MRNTQPGGCMENRLIEGAALLRLPEPNLRQQVTGDLNK